MNHTKPRIVHPDSKEALTVRLNEAVRRKATIVSQLKNADFDIENIKLKIKEKETVQELEVTAHAIERFKQRILNMPNTKVRKMLKDDALFRKVKNGGDGKYSLPQIPYCIVIVRDNAIITVYSKHDAEYRLDKLAHYMSYWVNRRIDQARGLNSEIMSFENFLNK